MAPPCAVQPVIADDQGTGQRRHDEDIAPATPEEDDENGQEVAAPEMAVGHGDVDQEEQQGKRAGKEQDEIGTERDGAHMGLCQVC